MNLVLLKGSPIIKEVNKWSFNSYVRQLSVTTATINHKPPWRKGLFSLMIQDVLVHPC